MKKCPKCKIERLKKEFTKDSKRKDGLDIYCKECKKEYRKNKPMLEYHRDYHRKYINTEHGEKVRTNGKLKRLYGITIEEYDLMFEFQNGRCKICGTEENGNKRFSVDHDHETGKVRGLLCYRCNTNLGWFENNKNGVFIYLEGEK